MKEKIFAALKTKYNGVQDAILNRVAGKLSETVTTEDQVQTAVDGVTFQNVLESYGDYRATEASNSAVTNYEKKHGIKDGKAIQQPNPGGDPNPKAPEDAPDWAKAIIQQNQELSQKVANFEKKGVQENLIGKVQKILSDKKIPTSYLKGRTIEIENEDQIETVASQIEKDYAEFKQELVNTGTVVDVPASGEGPVSDSESLANQIQEGTKQIVEQQKK